MHPFFPCPLIEAGCTTTAGGVVCRFLPPIASGRLAVRLLPVGLSVASCHRLRLAVWLCDYYRWGCLSLAVWLYDCCRWGCLSLPATDCVRLFGCTTAACGVVCRFLPPIASGRLAVRLLPVGLSVASCHRLRPAVWLYDCCLWGCLSLPATDCVRLFGCTTAACGVVCRFLPPIASGRLAVRLLPVGLSVASCHRLRLAVWLCDYYRWGCLSLAVWLYDCCRWGCLSLPATDCVRLFGCTTAACGVVCRFLPPIASGRLAVRLLPVGLSVASCHRLRQAVWLYDYCRWGCLSLPATDCVRPFGCTTAAGGVVCRFLPPIASGCLVVRLLPVGLSVASCHRLRPAVWLYDCCLWGCLSLPATDCVRLFGCTTAACGVVCRFLPPIASGRLAVRLLPVGLSVASCHRLRPAVWLYDCCLWGCLSLPATDCVRPFGCTTAAGGVVCRFLPPIASGCLVVRLLPVGLSVAGRMAV